MAARYDKTETADREGAPTSAQPSPTPGVLGPGRWHLSTYAAYLAAAWSVGYGALGLYWSRGGAGFPFGESDPAAVFSVLGGVRAEEAAPAIAALGLIGAVVAALTATKLGLSAGRPTREVLLTFAWLAAALLLVIVPDARALVAVAYAPIVLFGAPFGWPPGDYRDAIPWPVVNQFICIAGGLAWAATAYAYQRRTRLGGWHADAPPWLRAESAARWGRWTNGIAVVIPLVYAATRLAWALGIPIGLSEEFIRLGEAEGTWGAGAALAGVAIVGAILTLGLVQRWGEVVPAWVPIVGGKRVPPALAILPAALVAVLVTNAGLTFWRRMLLGSTSFSLTGGDWAALLPELLWPLWGAALGAATLAYYLRRRSK